jgi:hypothetical protein
MDLCSITNHQLIADAGGSNILLIHQTNNACAYVVSGVCLLDMK